MVTEAAEQISPLEPERTYDNLWLEYGTQLGMNEEMFSLISRDASRHYADERLRQHNFNHAVEVAWNLMELCDLYETKAGEKAPRKLFLIAAFYHDAGYAVNQLSEGFATKEQYSVHLFEQDEPAKRYGLGSDDIQTVERYIVVTTAGQVPEGDFEKMMQRADLKNVEGPPAEFLATTSRIIAEALALSPTAEAGNVLLGCIGALKTYYSNDLSLSFENSSEAMRTAHEHINLLAKRLTSALKRAGKSVQELSEEEVYAALKVVIDGELPGGGARTD